MSNCPFLRSPPHTRYRGTRCTYKAYGPKGIAREKKVDTHTHEFAHKALAAATTATTRNVGGGCVCIGGISAHMPALFVTRVLRNVQVSYRLVVVVVEYMYTFFPSLSIWLCLRGANRSFKVWCGGSIIRTTSSKRSWPLEDQEEEEEKSL